MLCPLFSHTLSPLSSLCLRFAEKERVCGLVLVCPAKVYVCVWPVSHKLRAVWPWTIFPIIEGAKESK
ncbi:GM19404 [Drosophila sechellia]|uniref:GD17782 n=2 Tax=melanogaster subgroup TaxID=32351 RepID=B4QZ31_DROSI|nr:GM19404 [Drosophila sechellia]EDX12859.1 GD17782 [Drosophila simulans]